MTVTEDAGTHVVRQGPPLPPPVRQPGTRDLQRTFRLLLATVWLTDAALQLQPFMFANGPDGFSAMLQHTAAGNPSWIRHTIAWNASVVAHHPVLTNTIFASVQFLIALGIAWRRTCRPALVLSVGWALAVWWFGEGLGGVVRGGATPLGGGPGAVLFYALLAVLLWPSDGPNTPFVAARTIGANAARALWAGVWLLLAVLAVVGHGRSPQALHDMVAKLGSGQPGWLVRIDRWSEAVLLHDGTTVAVLFALLCLLVAVSVYVHPTVTQVVLVVALMVFAVVWASVQDFGGELAGGATDPNSGLLLLLFLLLYWPLAPGRAFSASASSGRRRATMTREA